MSPTKPRPLTPAERRELVETPITVNHYGGGYCWSGSSGDNLLSNKMHTGHSREEGGPGFENIVDLYERE